jgi:hypothetical protein
MRAALALVARLASLAPLAWAGLSGPVVGSSGVVHAGQLVTVEDTVAVGVEDFPQAHQVGVGHAPLQARGLGDGRAQLLEAEPRAGQRCARDCALAAHERVVARQRARAA